MIRYLFIISLLSISYWANSQGEKMSGSPASNYVIENYLKYRPGFDFFRDGERSSNALRAGNVDTIDIPFFDDFSNAGPFPDRSKWQDAYVYVNRHFVTDAPTLGVASFDNLNWNGHPYQPINVLLRDTSDILTSQYIKLPFDTATYLSFYIEPRGLDLDPLDAWDSLVLYFYGKDGMWYRQWALTGAGLPVKFKQYFVKVNPTLFAHNGFMFRFINYSAQTGNSNHWHLDYVELNVKRSLKDTVVNDLAISKIYSGLMKNYYSLPWNQFKAMGAATWLDSLKINANNFTANNLNTQIELRYIDRNGNLLAIDTNRYTNIVKRDFSEFGFSTRFSMLNSLTPVSDTVVFDTRWSFFVPGDIHTQNDTARIRQMFSNYIAFDDGTAEAGYGVENTKNGKVACKFDIYTDDSLWALGVFFNQSYKNVRNNPFSLAIWANISPGSNNDSLIKTIAVNGPEYPEVINGFTNFLIDTPIFLKKGTYYFGWIQNSDFLLNMGVDLNYAAQRNFVPNDRLYYNVQKKWLQTFTNSGALMIRPYLGKRKNIPVPNGLLNSESESVQLFPNPTRGIVNFNKSVNLVEIYTISGALIRIYKGNFNQINMEDIPDGIYIVKLLTDENNGISYSRLVKINEGIQ